MGDVRTFPRFFGATVRVERNSNGSEYIQVIQGDRSMRFSPLQAVDLAGALIDVGMTAYYENERNDFGETPA